MDKDIKMPLSLKLVAWVFILFGFNALIDILVSLNTNRITLNFLVIELYIGVRLLLKSKAIRKVATPRRDVG